MCASDPSQLRARSHRRHHHSQRAVRGRQL